MDNLDNLDNLGNLDNNRPANPSPCTYSLPPLKSPKMDYRSKMPVRRSTNSLRCTEPE